MQNLPSPQQDVTFLLQTSRAVHLLVDGQLQGRCLLPQVPESQHKQFLCSALLLISLWARVILSRKAHQDDPSRHVQSSWVGI